MKNSGAFWDALSLLTYQTRSDSFQPPSIGIVGGVVHHFEHSQFLCRESLCSLSTTSPGEVPCGLHPGPADPGGPQQIEAGGFHVWHRSVPPHAPNSKLFDPGASIIFAHGGLHPGPPAIGVNEGLALFPPGGGVPIADIACRCSADSSSFPGLDRAMLRMRTPLAKPGIERRAVAVGFLLGGQQGTPMISCVPHLLSVSSLQLFFSLRGCTRRRPLPVNR